MKIELKIDGKSIELSSETLKNIKESLEEKKSFKPEYGEKYYFLTSNREIDDCVWENDTFDNYSYYSGNCFKTQEEAIKQQEKKNALMRVRKYIINNFGLFEPDWDDDEQGKYNIFYDYIGKEFLVNDACTLRYLEIIPFLETKEQTRQVIDNFKQDLKIIFDIK